jgi:hypothetical protein
LAYIELGQVMSGKKKSTRSTAVGDRHSSTGRFVTTGRAKQPSTTTKESIPLPAKGRTTNSAKPPLGRTSTKTSKSGLKDKAEIMALLHDVPVDWMLEGLRLRVREDNRSEPMLEFLTSKGERAKPGIERASGLSLSTEEAADMLGKTAETVRSHINNMQLIGYRAAADQTKIRLPRWQFKEKGLHDWVPRLIQAFGDNGWSLLDFVTVPRKNIEGERSYLDLLRAGRVDEVIAAASRANPD